MFDLFCESGAAPSSFHPSILSSIGCSLSVFTTFLFSFHSDLGQSGPWKDLKGGLMAPSGGWLQ